MTKAILQGYTIDEVDSLAKDLIQLICEMDTSANLAMLGLCRALVMLCEDEELDRACRVIDELSEVPFDGITLEDE